MRRMLAFTALSITTEEREAVLREADSHNSDGRLNRHEFMNLCISTLLEVCQLRPLPRRIHNA
jgi:Ca2+-binding EF-hand superfamily protein